MKSKIKGSILLLITVVVFILAGCKKPEAPSPTNPHTHTDTAMLMMHIHTNLGSEEVESDSVYANWDGKNIKLTRAEYYISGIKLIRTDDSIVSVSGSTLVKMDQESYMIGYVPVGSYKSITFDVGVQSADNHTDPSSHTGTDLAPQTPAMHFATNTDGYVFLAAEGLVDSTTGINAPNKSFSYHIGTDALRKTVTMGDHRAAPYNSAFTAVANGSMTIHMVADYNKLFHGVNMSTDNITNTTDVVWIANNLAANISSMFEYEE